jgi:hypothetical protein
MNPILDGIEAMRAQKDFLQHRLWYATVSSCRRSSSKSLPVPENSQTLIPIGLTF